MTLARPAALLMVIGAAAFPPAAFAHGEADWSHGLVDGGMLFFSALRFLLPVLMVALLSPRHGLRPITIQAATLGIGVLIAFLSLPVSGDSAAVELYARGYLIALGLLILFNLRLQAVLVLVLVLATGTLTGLEARYAVIGHPAAGFAPAVGFASSAICFYLPLALIASLYPEGWQRIAMRVVASWVVAIAAIDMAFMIVRSG